MNSSPDNHDSIRKLLAIKRYEKPPPGYFNSFSQKVLARIEAQSHLSRQSLWRQWFAEITAQPLLASTYGFLFAGLLVVAVGLAQSSTGEDEDIAIPGVMPLGAVYTLGEESPSGEFPFRRDTESQVPPSSLSPAPLPFLPFAIPSSPVDRAAYQP